MSVARERSGDVLSPKPREGRCPDCGRAAHPYTFCEPVDWREQAEWWRDMVSALTALVDSHFLLPHAVSHEARLRQVQTELHDMGAEWDTEWRSENQRLHERVEQAEALLRGWYDQERELCIAMCGYEPVVEPGSMVDRVRAWLNPRAIEEPTP